MDNIDEMPAGRELDDLIATNVMGWHRNYGPFWLYSDGRQVLDWTVDPLPPGWENASMSDRFRPSTSIEAAWLVVEKLKESKWSVCVEDTTPAPNWWVCFAHNIEDKEFHAEAPTPPLAISRAALKAVQK